MTGRCNASQDAQHAWDAGDASLASGRNADGSDAGDASLASGRNADGSDAGSVFADESQVLYTMTPKILLQTSPPCPK